MAEKQFPLGKVSLDSGVYRLARVRSVQKGRWYIGVFCKGCGKKICILEDRFEGADPNLFVGEGQISTPCPSCFVDLNYYAPEITSFQADEEIKSRRYPRASPSNMGRQPLINKYPTVKPSFGPGFLEDRPQAAAIIARCIALWSDVESELARLLATLLQANTEPVVAVFLSIQNSRAQSDALNAAAEVVLNEEDYELFGAIMSVARAVERERNNLAHGRYGGSDQIKDGIIWISPKDLTQHSMNVTLGGLTENATNELRKKCFVYELGDLEAIAANIETIHNHISFFIGYLVSRQTNPPATDQWRAERYVQLSSEPRIRQELSRIQAGRQQK